MKVISSLIITFVLGGLFLLVTPQQAAAACNKDTEIETSFSWGNKKCFPKETKDGSINNPLFVGLLAVFNFLAIGVGVVVTGGIIWGAIQYITANGNASQSQQGVMIIVNSVIGLVLFIFMYALLNFLVPGGLFK